MSFVEDVWQDVTGQTAGESAEAAASTQAAAGQAAIAEQRRASEQGLEFLQPFQQIGEAALGQASFLTDPQAQFEFLQSNPLFQSSLDAANRQTQNLAAARGRISAGDTLQRLSENVLLSASPLIGQQSANIRDLLGLGAGIAGSQANIAIGEGTNVSNLLTDIGASQAAGQVGAAQAQQAGTQNLLSSALLAGSIFSDMRLKENIRWIGSNNGINIFTWDWNEKAKELGLEGSSRGVMAQEVLETNPDAVDTSGEYLRVDYSMLGISEKLEEA